jgi:hypothetical protein
VARAPTLARLTGRDACPTLDILRCAYSSFLQPAGGQPNRQTLLALVNLLDIPLLERNFLFVGGRICNCEAILISHTCEGNLLYVYYRNYVSGSDGYRQALL